MTCDDVQIALEQQQRGVTPALAAAEIEDHLASCASCAAYLAVSRKVSESMSTALSLSPAPLDLAAMRARLARWRRETRRGLWVVPLVICVAQLLPVLDGARPRWSSLGVGLVFGFVIGFALLRVITRSTLARIASLEHRDGVQLIDGIRGELDRQIKDARLALWLMPALVVSTLALDDGLPEAGWPSNAVLIVSAIGLIGIPLNLVRLRRLRRERATVDA